MEIIFSPHNQTKIFSIISKQEIQINEINEFLDNYKNLIENEKDQLAIFIHFIMLQNGFYFLKDDEKFDFTFNQIKNSNDYHMIIYNSIFCDHKIDKINLCILKSGSFYHVMLKYKNFKSKFFKIDSLNLLNSENNIVRKQKIFDSILLNFKNIVLIPFKLYLKEEYNINLINGLLDLPVELIFKLCTKYLDVRSICSLFKSCKRFHFLLNSDQKTENSIWKQLLVRDFQIKLTNERTLNFKEEYIKQFLKKFKRKFSLSYCDYEYL